MLSYQHIYHAGNLLDVHKHFILANLISLMLTKPKPFTYLETHAGRGLYNLNSEEANKNKEYMYGIKQIKSHNNNVYFNTLKAIENLHGSNVYAGSAAIAKHLMPSNYYLYLCELHKTEFTYLSNNIKGYNVKLYNLDGLKQILNLSPTSVRRGIVFIDPSYEVKEEYGSVINFIKELHKKWSVAVIVVWYPVIDSIENHTFIHNLEGIGWNKKFINSLDLTKLKNLQIPANNRILGSKMLIINTPYGFEAQANAIKDIIN